MTDEMTESCGCVFCDLLLEPVLHDGVVMHRMADGTWVPCLKSEETT